MKFHERFDIDVNFSEAQQRFVNRVYNQIHLSFFLNLQENIRYRIQKDVASALGDKYSFHQSLDDLVGQDFLRNLQAIEAIFAGLPDYDQKRANQLVLGLLAQSEVDLEIEWHSGRFLRKGAALLDKVLVNDPLRWLRREGYQSVLNPFEKGLSHLLFAKGRPDLLSDVITDMYESLEALAKIVTKRSTKDLSANREMFVSTLEASAAYKTLLSDYITYANTFRHATTEGQSKPHVSEREVESFVYLTGVFVRLAMPSVQPGR
jgi:hypothetical protein